MFATVYAGLHHSNPRLWQEIKRHCRRRQMRGSTLVLLATLLCARSDAVAELCLGSTCSGPVHEDNAGPEHAHATRPHALNTNRRHAAKGGRQAHLSTRMRRDHTRQGNRDAHNSRGGPTKGGGRRGGAPRPHQGVAYSHNNLRRPCRNNSSVPPWLARGSLAPCTPLAVRGQPFRPGHGLFRYRENKQFWCYRLYVLTREYSVCA